MNLSYSKVDKLNLTKVPYIIHPDYGRCFNFSQANKYLFGIKNNLENVSNFDLKNRKIIFDYGESNKYDDYYIRFDKLKEYFYYVDSVTNFNGELKDEKIFLPFNYFLLKNKPIPENYNKIYMIFDSFKKYLKKVDTTDSRTILKYMGGDLYFGGYLSNYISNPFLLLVTFDTEDKPFNIGISKSNDYMKDPGKFIDITDDDSINFTIPFVYEALVKKLLYTDEKRFIISNLVRVIGNQSFAEMLFKSYSEKNTYGIPINELNEIIQFKNSNSKKEYMDMFFKKYINLNLYIKINGNYHINFEGFNKYLLNLEEEYLLNFRVKESINDMYFNITNELINCYRELYRNK